MSGLRDAADGLWYASAWLENAGSQCDGIPLIGSAVGYPLHVTASYLRDAVHGLDSADWQVASAVSQVQEALSTARDAYNYAAGYLQQQVQNAVSTAQQAYNYAAGYLQQQVQNAVSTAQQAYNYAAGYLQQQVQQALAAANSALTYAQTVSGNVGATAWAYIASGALQGWIQSWWNGQQQQILDFITPKLDVLIAQGFTVLDRSWTSFEGRFAWLLGKLIALMVDQAAHFAPALWGLLEAVLKNVQIPER